MDAAQFLFRADVLVGDRIVTIVEAVSCEARSATIVP